MVPHEITWFECNKLVSIMQTNGLGIGARFGFLEVIGAGDVRGHYLVRCGCGAALDMRGSELKRAKLCGKDCPLRVRSMTFDPSEDGHGVGVCHTDGCAWRWLGLATEWPLVAKAHLEAKHADGNPAKVVAALSRIYLA